MKEHLVIVGAGQAAAQSVQSARQLGFEGRISVVGEEPYPPYQRPPLSKKFLAGDIPRERLFLKPEKFYAERDVELLTGVRAEELDTNARQLRLTDDRKLAYDRLVLATGSRARRLDVDGGTLPGVHYLRTIADVDSILADLAPDRAVVIVGAGYIGLEVASVCSGLVARVTVLEGARRVMSRVVCPETAAFFAARHAAAGVDIRLDTPVSRFEGHDRVEAVVTEAGERIPCDLVIVGIGIEPNTELAERAGLECRDGIVVDSFARTADPHIVAAGDCTRQMHPWVGAEVRLESVHNAIEQGKAGIASVLGQPAAFDQVPWFWSDQYDVKLQIVGLAPQYDEVVLRADPASGSFSAFYLADGRLAAIDAINRPKDFLAGKRLLPLRPALKRETIEDTSIDLMSLGHD